MIHYINFKISGNDFFAPTGIDMQGRNGCWRICAKQHNGCKNLLEIIPLNTYISFVVLC